MGNHSFPAELYSHETMPNGEWNQCRAATTKGRQCRNPVFSDMVGKNDQEVVGYVNGWPAYRPLITLTEEEYQTMIAGVCYIHAD